MRKNKYGEDIHLVQVYFPLELLGKMKEQAKRHKRSLNKQILWLLEQRIENTAETLSQLLLPFSKRLSCRKSRTNG